MISNADLHSMLHGATHGLWVCWLYHAHNSRVVRVWNRDPMKPPLDRAYTPVGCMIIEA